MTNTTFFIHGHSVNGEGVMSNLWTQEVRQKDVPMAHHLAGFSYTATGYGKRIPTTYMVEFNGRWRRVYCCIYGNSGTLYIGKLSDNLIVRDY